MGSRTQLINATLFLSNRNRHPSSLLRFCNTLVHLILYTFLYVTDGTMMNRDVFIELDSTSNIVRRGEHSIAFIKPPRVVMRTKYTVNTEGNVLVTSSASVGPETP